MTNCCGVGALAKLAIGITGGTITRMDFNEFIPSRIVKVLSDGSIKAIRGTLDHNNASVFEGMTFVQFRVRTWVTSAKMAILLTCIGMPAASPRVLVDALPSCQVILGPAGGTVEHIFSEAYVSDWHISGQKGSDPILFDIGFIAKTWTTQAAATFFTSQSSPAMTEGFCYPFGAGVNNVNSMSLLGQTVYFPQFRLSMDYGLITEFNNSVTATNICPTDHKLTLATSALYSSCDSTEPLLTAPLAGTTTGASATLNFTRTVPGPTTYQTQFVVANMKAIARPPVIKKTDFQRLPLNFQGYADVANSTAMLTVTNA